MKVSEAVEKYIAVRDRRDERKQKFKVEDTADQVLQDKIEAALLKVMQTTGMDSVKTTAGTAYTTSRTTATVSDKEIFMNFVKERDEFPLLEVRASKLAIEQYQEVHNELPPGINWRSELSVNIRRSA